ncbi:DUF2812 domain-containing protein [Oceanobacillus timonensis]|uniref:DUF2812 domain-containing protein n=1 Tax=Oceanobacillus timonensis TaxID=1926285 RepID=UPI0015C4CDDD|nr:DUF2812 domain-containing protein [Oceanobacillus timonensis]
MNKKFVWNPARFFFHDTGTEKIEALSKEGWRVEKLQLGGLLFQLTEDTPKEVQYQLGFQPIQNIDEDTAEWKEGWRLIDAQDYMQVFEGTPEAVPMNMDQEQLLEQMAHEERYLRKYTIISCFFFLLLLLLHMNIGWPLVQMILLGGIIMLSLTFIFMLALYMLNKYRQYNLKNMS